MKFFAALSVFYLVANASAVESVSYEAPPINYSKSTPSDAIADLQKRINSQKSELTYDPGHGYLKSLLAELQIPVSSQVLVFSKTSLQKEKIRPRTPRAIYFNDDVYIGWVSGGEALEISSADPQLGGVFYTLPQTPVEKPMFFRGLNNCLQCHDSSGMTIGVPGHIVRSVFPDDEGTPRFNMSTYHTTDRSPFSERWGGWYVSGEAGALRHMGNLVYPNDPNLDMKRLGDLGANKTDLKKLAALDGYLTDTSDIVALLLIVHQAHIHNLLTRTNYETRIAIKQSNEINKLTKSPIETLTEDCKFRIKSNCESLLEALLFCKEARLTDPVKPSSTFAADFEKRGPFDAKGRSLRQFDLKTRIFKYPCSYLVYSKSFEQLPKEAREYLSRRMGEVLQSAETPKGFEHLSAEDRTAIAEILKSTLPEFTRGWK